MALVDLKAQELAGGHTIERHVGKSEADLRQRLANEPALPAASSFIDLAEAEAVVDAALHAHAAVVAQWEAALGRRGASRNLALYWQSPHPLGLLVARATGQVHSTCRVKVVLRMLSRSDRGYVVLTAFPVL